MFFETWDSENGFCPRRSAMPVHFWVLNSLLIAQLHSSMSKLPKSPESKPLSQATWKQRRLEIGWAPVSTNNKHTSRIFYLLSMMSTLPRYAKSKQIFVVKDNQLLIHLCMNHQVVHGNSSQFQDHPTSFIKLHPWQSQNRIGAPGGPTNNAPLGILAPSSEYLASHQTVPLESWSYTHGILDKDFQNRGSWKDHTYLKTICMHKICWRKSMGLIHQMSIHLHCFIPPENK